MSNSSLHIENLNESNYAEWSLYSMQSTLVKKGLWNGVEGSETCSLGLPNFKADKAFECHQAETHAKIILHLKPSHTAGISPCFFKKYWKTFHEKILYFTKINPGKHIIFPF